jgi:FkbM family methyltransferase
MTYRIEENTFKISVKNFFKKILRYFSYELKRVGVGSADLLILLKSIITKKKPIIFDVGAHHGETSNFFINNLNNFNNLKLYCFEPEINNFSILCKNNKNYSQIKNYNFGFSNSEGKKEFYINNHSATYSILPLENNHAKIWNNNLYPNSKKKCFFTTIDNFLKKEKINKIDLLKLDVQGAEFLVLNGSRKSLKEKKIKNVLLEISLARGYVKQKSLNYYINFFKKYDYELFSFVNMGYRKKDQYLLCLDAVFTIQK